MEGKESKFMSLVEKAFAVKMASLDHAVQMALQPGATPEEKAKQRDWLRKEQADCMLSIGVLEEAAQLRRAQNREVIEREYETLKRIREALSQITQDET